MSQVIEGIEQIKLEELKTILDQKEDDLIIIDVREHEEYVEGHIPGIPLIPMSEIVDLIEEFDSRKSYLFVCRSGRRSQEVAKFFKNNGYLKVQNFEGGMLSWDGHVTKGEEHIITSVKKLFEE